MTKPVLRFRKDGSFRILMLTDLHYHPDCDYTTIQAMDALIEHSRPDFVMLGGDNTTGKSTVPDFERLLSDIASPMEKRGIPWAHVFGNHDISREISKEYQQLAYEKYPMCLSEAGDDDLPGTGNYLLTINGSDGMPAYGIWALDSHQDFKMPSAPLGYNGDLYWELLMPERIASHSDSEFIQPEQVMWYYRRSSEFEREYGRKLPSVMFFHIPLAEFNAIIRNPGRCQFRGEYNETVCASEVNSGLFAAMLKRGDVRGVFCGHDHINTFDGIYCGIRMGYAGSIGYGTYGTRDSDPSGDKHRLRGGRIIDIDENNPSELRTEMIFARDVM